MLRIVKKLPDAPLFFHALRLGVHAQRIHSVPLHEVVELLLSLKFLQHTRYPEKALWASNAASRVLGRLGATDTCLTRALIMGALLTSELDTRLHIGFRHDADEGKGKRLFGHAWLSAGVGTYFVDRDNPFVETTMIEMKRNRNACRTQFQRSDQH